MVTNDTESTRFNAGPVINAVLIPSVIPIEVTDGNTVEAETLSKHIHIADGKKLSIYISKISCSNLLIATCSVFIQLIVIKCSTCEIIFCNLKGNETTGEVYICCIASVFIRMHKSKTIHGRTGCTVVGEDETHA